MVHVHAYNNHIRSHWRRLRDEYLRRTTPEESRVQTSVSHSVLLTEPSQKTLETKTISTMRRASVSTKQLENIDLHVYSGEETYFLWSVYQKYGAGSIPSRLNAAISSSLESNLIDPPTISPTPGIKQSTLSVTLGSSLSFCICRYVSMDEDWVGHWSDEKEE